MIKLKYKQLTMEGAKLKEGLYEQIINKEIQQQLNKLEEEKFIIDKDKIDKEEAKAILSQYISQVIRKSLNYIEDKEKEEREKLIKQIEDCNYIINILVKLPNEYEIKKYETDKNGEISTIKVDIYSDSGKNNDYIKIHRYIIKFKLDKKSLDVK